MSQLSPDSLFKSFQAAFPDLPSHTVVEVGLSGGLDSVVLLHLLHRMREFRHFDLRAVHVHHGLSTNADSWAKFCQDYCQRLNVALRVCRVNVEKQGKGLEAAARAARYRAFSRKSLFWPITVMIKSKHLCCRLFAGVDCAVWRLCRYGVI